MEGGKGDKDFSYWYSADHVRRSYRLTRTTSRVCRHGGCMTYISTRIFPEDTMCYTILPYPVRYDLRMLVILPPNPFPLPRNIIVQSPSKDKKL